MAGQCIARVALLLLVVVTVPAARSASPPTSQSDSSGSSGAPDDTYLSYIKFEESGSSSTSESTPDWLFALQRHAPGIITYLCKHHDAMDVPNQVNAILGTNGPQEAVILTLSEQDKLMTTMCLEECKPPKAPDLKVGCQEGVHEFRHTFRESAGTWAGMQFEILFIIGWVLVGAASRRFSPAVVPYTVGILIVGLIFGAIAETIEQDPSCPHNLLLGDRDGDGRLSRLEYNETVCIGCLPSSFCLNAGSRPTRWSFGKRTCGNGIDDSDCPFTFDGLDSGFYKSHMHVEQVTSFGNNGYIEPDETWTVRCNWLRDMMCLSDMDPHYLLVIFLPALLFESATFGIDLGIFRKQLWQILLLAFPAMIISSAITGALLFAHTESKNLDWTFWHCWLVGIIASATDPVAVVALLKDLGAAKNLGTLIEGESLLNDGSAVVLFTWVRNVVGYSHSTIGPSWMFSATGSDLNDYSRYNGQIGAELVRVVVQMLLMAVVLGAAVGKITIWMLTHVYEDVFIELSLMLGMSYLTFWLGELCLGSSAVIAVVVMGLVVNQGKGAVSPGSLHTIHLFYEMIAHFLNTLIFAICGVKLGIIVASGAFFIQVDTYLWLVIYPIILFARGVAILMFFPLLKRLGTGCTWKDAVVMWWGGLRGSVGLALALALMHTQWSHDMWGGKMVWNLAGETAGALPCYDVPTNALTMICFVVLMTVVINGITMAPLMKALGMTGVPDARQFTVNQALSNLTSETEKMMNKLKSDDDHQSADWSQVANVCQQHSAAAIPKERVGQAAWLHVLQMERASYLQQYENGTLSGKAYIELEEHMADFVTKVDKLSGGDEISREYDIDITKFWTELNSDVSSSGVALTWSALVAYKQAMKDVNHMLHHDPQYASVVKEHEDNEAQIHEFLEKLRKDNADLVRKLETKHAAQVLLRKQCDHLQHLKHEGCLSDLDTAKLLRHPNKQLSKLNELGLQKELSALRAALPPLATTAWKSQGNLSTTIGTSVVLEAHKSGGRAPAAAEVVPVAAV